MRDIPNFDGYRVDKDGAVWSRRKSIGRTWKRLRPATNEHGYKFVAIRRNDGERKTVRVHRLVLLAYVGEPLPEQTHTRHLDGDKLNNKPSNLCWGTPKENAADMRRHETQHTKISPGDVREVRRLSAAGFSLRQIAANLPIGKTEVHRIVRGVHWAWVGGE